MALKIFEDTIPLLEVYHIEEFSNCNKTDGMVGNHWVADCILSFS